MKKLNRRLSVAVVAGVTASLVAATPVLAATTSSSAPAATRLSVSHSVSTKSASKDVHPDNVFIDIGKRAFIYALRHGGPALGNYLARLSPKAGALVEKYSLKLADVLESVEKIEEWPIYIGLVHTGVPPADALIIAKSIVFLFGV